MTAVVASRMVAVLRIAALVLCLLAGAAAAQDNAGVNLDGWAESVARAEATIGNPDTEQSDLEALRQDLAERRQVFQAAESTNQAQIDRVNRQLETLGPAPAEGETEPESISQNRAELNEQLAALQEPGRRATQAYVEADGLIAEIDAELRERQARRVLARSPIPLNPLNWLEPLGTIRHLALELPAEILAGLRAPEERAAALDALPVALATILVGLLLLFRTTYWIDRFDRYVSTVRKGPAILLLRGLLALLQLGLPTLGIVAVLAGLELTTLFGDEGSTILLALGAFAISLVLYLWLVRRLFPSDPDRTSPLLLSQKKIGRGRVYSRFLIVALAVANAVDTLAENADIDAVTRGYVMYPIVVVVGLLTIRIMRLLITSSRHRRSESEATGFSAQVVGVLATLGVIGCAVGILAGLAGYLMLAERIVLPAATTFLILGFMALLQAGFTRLYSTVSRRGRSADDSLVPIVFGTVMILLSLPVLALLWGALPTDLQEFWDQIRGGFLLGGVRISPQLVFQVVVVFSLLFALTRVVQGALRTTILPKTHIDIGGRNAIVAGIGYVGVLLAVILAFTTAGIDLSSLAILASALAVGIGFGLQTIVSNFVSGIILLVERPVSEGDWIEVAGQMGYVRRISVRATVIETFDRTDVIVPNSDLISGQVTNWTRGNLIGRVIIPVSVARGTDTRKVERILMEIAEAQPMVVLSPPPQVLFMGFGEGALEFEIRAILRDINFMLSVKSDVNHAIVQRFTEEEIEIPFPQRDIRMRTAFNAEADEGRAPPESPARPFAQRVRDQDGGSDADGDADAGR